MKMTVSYEWLCDLVQDLNQKSPEQIGLALTALGAETEDISVLNYGDKVELAMITKIEALNKLSKVTIAVGDKTYTVVSNSPILKENHYVLFAPIGATIFGGISVTAREIEGVTTEGLLLALENLGIENKSSDIAHLGDDKKIAAELFDIYCKQDAIYTLDVPGNRADWLSIRGLARALAISFDLSLKDYTYNFTPKGTCDIKIDLQSDRCFRYSLTTISNITACKTPAHIQKRLLLLGMRPISYLVDMSNATMLETGQPTHAFDATKIKGSIIVRQAKNGETLTLLDDSTINLTQDDLLICDEEKILALAGIMGGLDSGITEDTKEIYLEAASFNGVWVRRSAKRLGIKTESSLRFEKNITSELVPLAQQNICDMIAKQLPQTTISIASDISQVQSTQGSILVSPQEIRDYLGAPDIKDDFMKKVIINIGCTCDSSQEQWNITPSGERRDLNIKEDIMEEIARFYGYDKIPSTNYRPSSVKLNPEKSFDEKIRPILRGMGLSEAITIVFRSVEQQKFYGLTQANAITIVNPLNTEWTEIRTHLFDGLLDCLKTNVTKAFQKNIALSEIASTFTKKTGKDFASDFCEQKVLSFVISNENNPYQKALNVLNNIVQYAKIPHIKAQRINADDYTFLHPLNAFEIMVNDKVVGFFGEIHPLLLEKLNLSDKKDFPSPVVCEISFDTLREHAEVFNTVSKVNDLPPMFRDITLSVDSDALSINLCEELKSKNSLIKDIEFVSVFQNEKLKDMNKKNISLRMRFESDDALNAQEIDLFIQELLK